MGLEINVMCYQNNESGSLSETQEEVNTAIENNWLCIEFAFAFL